uniref:Uncharacterized protein n=1 Tax=Noctiluca scintillans TaxID=2966 RepID=A0A7S1F2H1_NOCSC|mmetsp:Transcript_2918/g.8551  ORF Transcript_2918/g.8551 Transcript_2918/m.8551 type:complete len:194 (+) Transcript_2918:58-639(+)|eukprot:CAMPEP_0194503478 /NCGR_PEP_ID=MMETSP0253-20130528/28402_1 /TAXON_ID=2966 /ORGANISM="Noctiluca scintillans" /LENGTH=193 /DNA_ID=CAMNT_0039345765 /DNA_START=47 /DNA_END=628 /DNA_ORIENTATION=-
MWFVAVAFVTLVTLISGFRTGSLHPNSENNNLSWASPVQDNLDVEAQIVAEEVEGPVERVLETALDIADTTLEEIHNMTDTSLYSVEHSLEVAVESAEEAVGNSDDLPSLDFEDALVANSTGVTAPHEVIFEALARGMDQIERTSPEIAEDIGILEGRIMSSGSAAQKSESASRYTSLFGLISACVMLPIDWA